MTRVYALACAALLALAPLASHAQTPAPTITPLPPETMVPARTSLRFHVDRTLASNVNHAGDRFGFELLDPIVLDGQTIVAAHAVGRGVLLVSGHAGTGGHEGDLTLKLEGIPTADGHWLEFDDQQLRLNGRDRKAVSFLAGFIPFVGYGSSFIRGAEIVVPPEREIMTVLSKAAVVVAAAPPLPSPSPSPHPSATATPGA